MKCVPISDHKFVALHAAVWSGGSFVYVPKGVKVDIPSYTCKPGDVISVKEQSLNHAAIKASVEATLNYPAFVEFDKNKLTGTFLRYPDRSELNQEINESLIVEYYNR